jgi:hypothetical protein
VLWDVVPRLLDGLGALVHLDVLAGGGGGLGVGVGRGLGRLVVLRGRVGGRGI